jgi:hypothetical protein
MEEFQEKLATESFEETEARYAAMMASIFGSSTTASTEPVTTAEPDDMEKLRLDLSASLGDKKIKDPNVWPDHKVKRQAKTAGLAGSLKGPISGKPIAEPIDDLEKSLEKETKEPLSKEISSMEIEDLLSKAPDSMGSVVTKEDMFAGLTSAEEKGLASTPSVSLEDLDKDLESMHSIEDVTEQVDTKATPVMTPTMDTMQEELDGSSTSLSPEQEALEEPLESLGVTKGEFESILDGFTPEELKALFGGFAEEELETTSRESADEPIVKYNAQNPYSTSTEPTKKKKSKKSALPLRTGGKDDKEV